MADIIASLADSFKHMGVARTVNGHAVFRPNTIAMLVCLVPLVSVAGAAVRAARK